MKPQQPKKNKEFNFSVFPKFYLGIVFSLSFLVVIFAAQSSYAESQPESKVNEIIVEFTDDVSVPADVLLAQRKSFASILPKKDPSLDVLMAKYRVPTKKVRPLFPELASGKTKLSRKKMLMAQSDAANHRYPHRSKRSRKDFKFDPQSFANEFIIPIDPIADPEIAAADFAKNPFVKTAQPNYKMKVLMVPNDPYYLSHGSFGQQLGNGDYEDMWALKKVKPEQAWDTTQGLYVSGEHKGEPVIVAVVDTGVDYNHPDIARSIWVNPGEDINHDGICDEKDVNGKDNDGDRLINNCRGWNVPNRNADPMDRKGHGTAVAGIIAAQGNNFDASQGKYIGMIGVAPQAKIMPVRVFADGGYASTADVAIGIKYAVDHGADIINFSLGGCDDGDCSSIPSLESKFYYAYSKQVLIVSAAGNEKFDIMGTSPQNTHLSIVVSAYDQDNNKCGFSNFGLVDVAAPGCSTKGMNILSLARGGVYDPVFGTSFAAPLVTGAAALLMAKNPSWTLEQVRQAIRQGALDVDAKGYDFNSGYGLLDISKSMSIINPPEVFITKPYAYEALYNNNAQISIYGIANLPVSGNGYSFGQWTLDYGNGEKPTLYTTIASSTTPVATEAVLGTWDLSKVNGGVHTLRLTVVINTPTGPVTYTDQRVYNKNMLVDSYRVSISKNGSGVIDPFTNIRINKGASQTISIIPDKDRGSFLDQVMVDGTPVQPTPSNVVPNTYVITLENVNANHDVAVNFTTGYSITANVLTSQGEASGRIVPSGVINVPAGSNQTFNIAANTTSIISSLKVDNVEVSLLNNATNYDYTFRNVTSAHSIDVTFKMPLVEHAVHNITPERITVGSGEVASMTFGVPSGIIPQQILFYMYCPSGLTIGLDHSNDICNQWIYLSLPVNSYSVKDFKVTNNTGTILKAVPNFYIYKEGNPNYGYGVSGEITVQPAAVPPPVLPRAQSVTVVIEEIPQEKSTSDKTTVITQAISSDLKPTAPVKSIRTPFYLIPSLSQKSMSTKWVMTSSFTSSSMLNKIDWNKVILKVLY